MSWRSPRWRSTHRSRPARAAAARGLAALSPPVTAEAEARRRSSRRPRGLHDVVRTAAAPVDTVLVGSVLHDRRSAPEVVERWRGGRGPFERGRLPRVVGGLGTAEPAADEVEQENQLGGAGEERG